MSHFIKKSLVIFLTFLTVFATPAFSALADLGFANTAFAATFNEEINYQGKLANTANVAVPDGAYHMRFALYTTATGGSPVWNEDRSTAPGDRIALVNGLFSVMLGSSTPLTSVDFNQPLYLGVEIGGDGASPVWDGEMTPRKLLGAVPAAFVAETANTANTANTALSANTLQGLDATKFVRTDATSTIATSSTQTLLTVNQQGSGSALDIQSNASSVFKVNANGFVATNSTTTNATSTTLAVTTLGVNGDTFTDLTGTGLQDVGGTLTLDTSGDWTGTLNGHNGAYYLQNAFSTTSANYWKTQNDFFSTTSASYFLSVNGSNAFSTSSADYWKSQRDMFSTTSSAYFLSVNQGNAFSTTSATNFLNLNQGLAFSTTSATNFLGLNQSLAFSTTSASYFLAQNGGNAFSTTSANYFADASTTIPKTYSNNTFTGSNVFATILANGSTTLQNFTFTNATGTSATTTNFFATKGTFTTASSTNLFATNSNLGAAAVGSLTGAGLTTCTTGSFLQYSGGTFGCAADTNASSTLLSDNNSFSGNDTFTNTITGSITGNAGTATKLQTARTINTVSFDGTSNITITAASSTALADNNTFSGTNQFNKLTFTNATGTNATATNIFATTASSSNLFATTGTIGALSINTLVGAGLTTCNGASNALTYNAGTFGCNTLVDSSFSTTSADYWKTQRDFFSTTSASYFLSVNQGNAFSTTSASYFLGQNQGFAFSTTSATNFLGLNQSLAFSTTSASYFLAQNGGNAFSTTSANYYTDASTTIPKTYSNNTFTGSNIFATILATGSTTLQNFTGVTSTTTNSTSTNFFTTNGTFTTASSTNLFATNSNLGVATVSTLTGAGLTTCTAASSALTWNSGLFGCHTVTAASSTILSDNNSFSGNDTFTNTITGSITGNAGTATKLATARTIAITGDLTYTSPSFDGSGNVTAAGTLATVNGNVGSFGGANSIATFTVNGKGLITAAGAATPSIPASEITTGTFGAGDYTFPANLTVTSKGTFANILATGSSTLQNFTGVTSTTTNSTSTTFFATNGTFTTASSTNLFATTGSIGALALNSLTGAGLTTCNSASNAVTYNAGTFGCNTLALGAAYPFGLTGNATSTLTQFNGGLTAYASSTIGNGLAGLTVNGNATTTGNAYFAGNVGVGSTTPSTNLSVAGNGYFTGGLGIGMVNTTAGTLKTVGAATIGGSLAINIPNCNSSSQALQSDGSGILGCGTITGGGASVGGGWTSIAPNIVRLSTTTDLIGVGTTSPYAKVSINSGSAATTTLALVPVSGQTANILDIYDTANNLSSVLTAGGNLGLGTTSPFARLSVVGDISADGNIRGTNFTATGTLNVSGNTTLANATSTNFFATTASSTNLFATTGTIGALSINTLVGAGLTTCNGASNALTYNAGTFGCNTLVDSSFSTTSADYWKTQRDFFSTTSASYFLSVNQGNAFSTTSASYFLGQNQGFAFSTTSATNFLGLNQSLAFSTTSASYFLAQNGGNAFSTTSANYYTDASTTIPKTYSNNTFTGSNIFATILATGSTTLQNFTFVNATGTSATTTNFFATTASTSQLFVSTGSGILKSVNGLVSLATAGTDYVTPGALASAYPFGLTGNATSTLTQFNGGLTAFASSTIGNGNGNGGLTVAGNSTTTGNAYIAGNLGIGTNSPTRTLDITGNSSVNAIGIKLNDTEGGGHSYSIINGLLPGVFNFKDDSTGKTPLTINALDNIGIGTTTPYAQLAVWGSGTGAENAFQVVNNASTTEFSVTDNGLATAANLLATGSTTLQNFTFTNATGTSATTTNFFATTASTSNLFIATGSCSTSSALNVVNGKVVCGVISGVASSTILSDNNSFSGNDTFTNTITGSITGNAGTATKLATARTIAITGDLTYTSPSFDGSGNVTAAGTLATVNGNVGSFTNANITVNAKGLITAASNGTDNTSSSTLFTDTNTFSGTNQFNKLTFTNATGTSATTTNFFATNGTFTTASSTNLFANVATVGTLTAGTFTGAGLTACNSGSFLQWSGGTFGCATDTTFSTTSANYWKTQNDFFSTTSASYFLSVNQGNAFSTTSATNFLGLNQSLAFSTTSASYFLSQNTGASFSTTSANYFVNASTTIPKTYSNNVFTGTNTFTNATATNFFATTASSSNLFSTTGTIGALALNSLTGAGLTTCTTGSFLQYSGGVFSCAVDTNASSTLLSDNNSFSGNDTFTNTITGSITGNAGTATKLATARTIAITGDLTYTSPSFDGSGNVTAAGTLATVNGNVGSFGGANSIATFTVNGKGLITAAGAATPSIPASEITTGTFGAGDYTFPANLTVTSKGTFANILATGSSTLQNFTGVTSTTTNSTSTTFFATNGTFTTASSTNLFATTGSIGALALNSLTGAGLTTCNSASNAVTYNAGTFGCNTLALGAAYPFGLTGNATSTLTQFNGGLTAYASSTIGNGLAGLTVNGNATTTGNQYIVGSLAVGNTGPNQFTVDTSGNLNANAYALSGVNTLFGSGGNTILRATTGKYLAFQSNNTENMRLDSTGNLGIGTTSPFAKLSVAGDAYIGGNLTATGTLNVLGNTTLANATSTNFFSTTASSTNLFATNSNLGAAVAGSLSGAGLSTCNSGSFLQYSSGIFGCAVDTNASSTLLADNNSFSGNDTFTNTITGSVSGNAGTATKFQTARTINTVSFDGTGNIVITAASSTLLANNNAFSGNNLFTGNTFLSASTTIGNGTTALTVNGNATTTGVLNVLGAATSTFGGVLVADHIVTNTVTHSLFAGAVDAPVFNALSTTASSTFANGIHLTGGCLELPDGTCLAGASSITSKWSDLLDPTGDLALNMGTHSTSFNWSTGTGGANLYTLSTDLTDNGTGALLLLNVGSGSTVKPFRSIVGSTEALTIDSTANVGIGLNNPGYKAEIRTTSGNDTLSSLLTPDTQLVLQNNDTSAGNFGTVGFANNSGAVQALLGAKFVGSGSTDGSNLIFATRAAGGANLSERLRITDAGNVGIGTTSPYARLSVTGAGSGSERAFEVVNNASTTEFSVTDNGLATAANLLATGSTTLQNFTFTNATGTSATTTNFFATTASTSQLFVSTGSGILKSVNGLVSLAVSGTDYVTPGALASAYPFQLTGNATSTLTQFNGGLTAYASSTIGNGNTGLTVNGAATTTGNAYFAGNVGIGTTSPFAVLSVKGADGGTGNAPEAFAVYGGDGGSHNGGQIDLVGGGSQSQAGGVNLTGGPGNSGGTGGYINIISGSGNGFGGSGGNISLLAGNGNNPGGAGNIILNAGFGSGIPNGNIFLAPSAGNVGIGIATSTTPKFTLEVNGTASTTKLFATFATTTNATSTNFFATNGTFTTASSTNLFATTGTIGALSINTLVGAGLTTCNGASNALTYNAGTFGCNTLVDSSFSTTSADYWKTQRDFFSTTSASYFLSVNQGNAFSTTSASYFLGQNQGFAFSTTSATNFLGLNQSLAFSTTSASYFLAQNGGNAFSTTSANYYTDASTTIPKTYSNNTFTGSNIFATILATGSTTLQNFTGVTSTTTNSTSTNFFTTNGTFTTASSTNLFATNSNLGVATVSTLTGAGLTTCTAASSALTWNSGLFGCHTVTAASSTILSDNNSFSGNDTFTNTITGSITGNAGTATKLATARTIAITGDLTYTSPSFDGSGNVTAAGTLATVNGNVGSFGGANSIATFTVNGKGLITAAGAATPSIPASEITTGTFGAGDYTFPANLTVTSKGTFANILATGSSTLQNFTGVTSTTTNSTSTTFFATNGTFTTASSTNLFATTGSIGALALNSLTGAGLTTCNSASNAVTYNAGTFGCNTLALGAAYPFGLTGNATSTLTQFNGGLTAYASSTIGGGSTTTGLTINGGATTTGTAYFAGNVGVGTNVPTYKLDVRGTNTSFGTSLDLFNVQAASANGSGYMRVDQYGNTYMNGVVVGYDNNFSSPVVSSNGNPTYITSDFSGVGNDNIVLYPHGSGKVGVGTSSPLARLDVAGANNATSPLFQLSSVSSFATTTRFSVDNSGNTFVSGSTTLQNFTFTNATGTSATTTNFFATTASTSNLFIATGSCSTSSALNVVNGKVVCGVISGVASSTILSDNNSFSGNDTFTNTITGSITGNAGTATKLATARTIAITGDLTYTSPSFDGSGNVTAAGTLATVNGNVGSFGGANSIATFTVNGKGLITAAGAATPSIPASEITTGTFGAGNYVFPGQLTVTSSTTLQNFTGVTSTTTNSTSTTFFATNGTFTTASSSNLFATTGSIGALALNSLTGAGLTTCNSGNFLQWSSGLFGCATPSGSGTVNSGIAGQVAFYGANGTAISGTSTLSVGTTTADMGNIGIGTTSPFARLSVQGASGTAITNAPVAFAVYGGDGGNNNGGDIDLVGGPGGAQAGNLNFTGGLGGGGGAIGGNLNLSGGNSNGIGVGAGNVNITGGTATDGISHNALGGSIIVNPGSGDIKGNIFLAPSVGNVGVGIATSTTPNFTLEVNGTASTTKLFATFATTTSATSTNFFATNGTFTTASSTNLFATTGSIGALALNSLTGAGLTTCNSASNAVTYNAGTFGCNTLALGAAYPFGLTGNATSTLTQFNGGLTAYASSTIGNGTGLSGLTINGYSTTTGTAYFSGNVRIGTIPDAVAIQLRVASTDQTAEFASNLATTASNGRAFLVGVNGENFDRTVFYSNGTIAVGPGSATRDTFLSRPSANTFQISSAFDGTGAANLLVNGSTGIGTTSPFAKLSVAGDTYLGGNLTATGTLTLAALTGTQCLHEVGGVVSGTGSDCGSGTSVPYAFPLTGNATSTLTQFNGGLTAFASSTIGNGGVAGLTINGNATTTGNAYFAGNVGVGTTSPYATLSVAGNIGIDQYSSYEIDGRPVLYASSTTASVYVGLGGTGGTSMTSTNLKNTAVGTSALIQNGACPGACFSGFSSANSAFGYKALSVNTTGQKNTALGALALQVNSTGQENTALGNVALTGNSVGSYNVGLGASSLVNSNGSLNTALGYQSGHSLSTGENNIVIGANVDLPSNTGNNQLNIGNLLYGTGIYNGGTTTNTMSSSPTAGFIGIGTSSPFARLSVAGDAYIGGNVTATGTLTVQSDTTLANATSTNFFATTASSTNLFATTGTIGALALNSLTGAGLTICNSASNAVTYNAGTFGCNTLALGAAYPFGLTGNATSTLTQFNGGLTAYASSTIGDGSQGGGLTINGGATTTAMAYFASNVGIGTTTPFSLTTPSPFVSIAGITPGSGSIPNVFNVQGGTGRGGTIPTGGEGISLVSGNGGSGATTHNGGKGADVAITAGDGGPSGSGTGGAGGNISINPGQGGSGGSSGLTGNVLLALQSSVGGGNVGIGTSSPFAKLSVAGDAYIGGNLTATGTLNVLGNTTLANATSTTFYSTTASSSNLYLATGSGCLQVDSAGHVFSIGSACGTGSGSVTSVSNGDGSLTISPTTGVVAASINLANSNIWTSASTTFVNGVTIGRATTTSATSTNFFATNGTFTTASSTNLFATTGTIGALALNSLTGAGLTICNSASNAVTYNAGTFGCNTLALGAAYPFQLTGNATSTLTQFNGGLTAFASSTIGNGNGNGGLTVAGNSTTTGNAYIAGNLGIGTNSPTRTLDITGNSSVNAIGIKLNDTEGGGHSYSIINGLLPGVFNFKDDSTGKTPLTINALDNIGIGTTTPYAQLAVWGSGTGAENAFQVVNNASTTEFSVTDNGLATAANLLATGSSTLQNFTFVNATGTSATTTNFFATTASTSNLFIATGSCSTSSALNVVNGKVVCGVISGVSSSTLLANNNSFSGNDTFTNTITGSITGNAGTATKLATARTIAITGDLTYTSPSFDGSGNVTAAGTLATVNGNVGSFGGANSIATFTVNGKGLITAAGAATPSIPASEITTGTFGAGDYTFPANLTVTSKGTFANILATGSSTLQNFTGVTSTTTNSTSTTFFATNGTFTTASSSNLFATTGSIGALALNSLTGAGLTTCNSASNAVTYNAGTFGCNTLALGAAYPFGLTGNATSTLTQFNGGLTAYASSTIGNGLAGLTVNGNATTTGNAYIAGFAGFGTTTSGTLAKLNIDQTINSTAGSAVAIAGEHGLFTFNPTAGGVQIGNRFDIINIPTSVTNTAVGELVRVTDSSALSNLVRGLDVTANGGSNTFGVNTGIRGSGATFGVQGVTNGLAGGTSTPAALYGENDGTTQGDVLRLYTNTMTTATSVATFYQETSAYSGNGLYMDFGRGGGTFTGNYVNFLNNGNSRFQVTAGGTTTIGQIGQTSVQAGLQIGYGGLCVDNDGSCTASTTGRITAVQYNTANADLAESYVSSNILDQGDIVKTTGAYSIDRAATSSDGVIGVVSTRPGITLGDDETISLGGTAYPVALSGRVPVKLSTENGPIAIGDQIMLSSIPGVGMKATPEALKNGGTIVGTALEAFDGSTYLSQATVSVMTTEIPTGSKVCTTKTLASGQSEWGGSDVDGKAGYKGSGPTSEQVCVDQYSTKAPDNGTLPTQQVGTTTVKIGKALLFVNIDRTHLTVSGPVAPLATLTADMNAGGFSLVNVRGIASATGSWSIDADGNLTVQTIRAQNGYFDQSIQVGTAAKPTGITIYDSVTGLPYCMGLTNGVMKSSPGICSAMAPLTPSAGSNETPPSDNENGSTTPSQGGDATSTPPSDGTASSTPPTDTGGSDGGNATSTPESGGGQTGAQVGTDSGTQGQGSSVGTSDAGTTTPTT